MKSILIATAFAASTVLPGRVETEITTTAPDGTVTVTKSKAPAPGSLELVGQGIAVAGGRRIEATK